MFNHLNKANIAQIEAAVNHHDEIYFHGDGNIYHKKEESDHRKEFSNNRSGAQTYRVKFTKYDMINDTLPKNVEELEKALLNAKNNEAKQESKPKEQTSVSTFKVKSDPAPAAKKDNGSNASAEAEKLKAEKETLKADKETAEQQLEEMKKQLADAESKNKELQDQLSKTSADPNVEGNGNGKKK